LPKRREASAHARTHACTHARTASPHAPLHRHRRFVRRRRAQEVVLELHHACITPLHAVRTRPRAGLPCDAHGPALVKRRLASPAGTSDDEGTAACPRCSKKATNRRRSASLSTGPEPPAADPTAAAAVASRRGATALIAAMFYCKPWPRRQRCGWAGRCARWRCCRRRGRAGSRASSSAAPTWRYEQRRYGHVCSCGVLSCARARQVGVLAHDGEGAPSLEVVAQHAHPGMVQGLAVRVCLCVLKRGVWIRQHDTCAGCVGR
jgi:hypothetical protein